jgi:ABC-type multidrug transport system fused ATPase/permease subunit
MGSAHLMHLFYDFVKEHPSIIFANIVFILVIPVSDILLPHLYGKIMDAMRLNGNLFTPFLHVVILMAIVQALFLLSDYHDSKLMPYLQNYIRGKIVNKILENYEEQHTELELGNIISKIIKVPAVMVEWVQKMKNFIIPYVLVFILATGYFIYVDIQLGVALFVILLLFTTMIVMSPHTCGKVSFDRDTCSNDIHENIDDVLRNLFSVYGSNQKEQELRRLAVASDKYNKLYEGTIKCILKFKFWLTPLVILYLIFFIYRSYNLIKMKEMKASTFVSIFIILLYVLGSMTVINDEINDIIIELGMISASSDIIDTMPKKIPVNDNMYPIPPSGIGLNNVFFSFPDSNKNILSDVSLHIKEGEKLCITGEIGSGKSTLIKLLLKYQIQDSGTIYWNGRNYKDISITEIRSKIGYVPQQPVLFNRSIIDNVMYGNTSYSRKDVENILEQFDIKQDFMKFDNGLDTIIGKNGSKISGGQRQLVWCLRVLLSNPDIIILDEPTASIDEKTKDILHRMLNTMMKNKTVIMVTHDDYLMKLATRTIYMRQGVIINAHSSSSTSTS